LVACRRNKQVAAAACTAVAAVVKADRHGDVMLEVVQLVADLVKKRDCRCDPEACALQPHKSKSISRVPIPIQFINHVLRDAFKGPQPCICELQCQYFGPLYPDSRSTTH